jgi:hypothetical protein
MKTDYAFAVVDLSYLLQRNLYACSRGRKIGEFTAGDVVKMTIQTLNKIPRDYKLGISKYILLADKWSADYDGYYRHYILSGIYKTSRTWMTPEKLKEIEENPKSTEKEIEKARFDLYLNNVKLEAKEILKTELRFFGVPCIWQDGWEFDDCAYLFACLWYNNPDTRKSVIITKDSDLKYSTNPKVDYFRLPAAGSQPEIIDYNQMYYEIPEDLRDLGVSLYDYKSYLESLGLGHNDMKKTKLPKADTTITIKKIISGDYSWLSDPEVFKLQYSTFDISKFPGLQEIIGKLTNDIYTIGHLGSLDEFHNFCGTHGITGISDKYYSSFISRFDQKLFSE